MNNLNSADIGCILISIIGILFCLIEIYIAWQQFSKPKDKKQKGMEHMEMPLKSAYEIISQGYSKEEYQRMMKKAEEEKERIRLERKLKIKCGFCGCIFRIRLKDMASDSFYFYCRCPNCNSKKKINRFDAYVDSAEQEREE